MLLFSAIHEALSGAGVNPVQLGRMEEHCLGEEEAEEDAGSSQHLRKRLVVAYKQVRNLKFVASVRNFYFLTKSKNLKP